MAIFSMIPTAIGMLRDSNSWIFADDGPFGQLSCKLLQFSQASSMSCSILSLTALAFERFFAVVFPMQKVLSIRRTLRIITVIWVATIALTCPFLYAGKVRRFDGVPFCIEDWSPAFHPKQTPEIVTIVSFVFLYALPLIVISVVYSIITAKVWGRRSPGNATQANRRVLNKSKKNVLKLSVAVVLAFAFGWFLIHLNLFLFHFSDVFKPCGIPLWLQNTGFFLGHANSAINCLIYVIFSDNYRRGFKEVLKPLFSKCSRGNSGSEVAPAALGIPLGDRVVLG